MHKQILKSIAAFSTILILVSACNITSDESADTTVSKAADTSADTATQVTDCKVVPPKEPLACTMQYDPVCGCDGKTYGNACSARGAGVPHSTPGACEKEPAD